MSTSVRQARRPAAAPSRRAAAGYVVPAWTVAVVGLLAALVITAVTLLTARHSGPEPQAQAAPPPTAVIAEIDGQKIPLRELALYLAQDRAATFAHFQQTYGATDGPHFWTTAHGGQTPADYLKKRALTDVTRASVVLELAHRHRLIADPGYDAFLTAWTDENARRRQAVAAHQVIYGPVQYTEANYFTYVLHDLDARLEQVLTQSGTIPAPESALRAYYHSHLDAFRQQDATTRKITTPRFGQVVQQVRQAYVRSRYQAMTTGLARTARVSIEKPALAAVPVD